MSTSDRDQRLAAKLRENLRRRKAQAKARTAPKQESNARGEGGESDKAPGEKPRE